MDSIKIKSVDTIIYIEYDRLVGGYRVEIDSKYVAMSYYKKFRSSADVVLFLQNLMDTVTPSDKSLKNRIKYLITDWWNNREH